MEPTARPRGRPRRRAEVDLADDFHVVRLEMVDDDAIVKIDGKVVLDLTGKSTWDAHAGRNLVGFGSLSSAATGEAWWDRVTWCAEQPEVEVYPRAQHLLVDQIGRAGPAGH